MYQDTHRGRSSNDSGYPRHAGARLSEPDLTALKKAYGEDTLRIAADAIIQSRSLKEYVVGAWPHVEPKPFIDNWHIGAYCEHLTAVTQGQIENLLINVPPGTSKSLVVSVFWPTWEWTSAPQTRGFFASYKQDLSVRDSVKSRALINSLWYRARWGQSFSLSGDQNLKMRYDNTAKGYRISTSVGSGIGEHPDRIVIDDPHNPEGAESETERESTLSWWDLTISTRGVSRGVRKVVIMQRLHENDLSGHILQTDARDWVHLCLPMRYDPKRMCVTPIGWKDPRVRPGELLAPVQFPEPAVSKMERLLGTYGAAGQLQQIPSPGEGGIIKRAWWKFYHEPPMRFDRVLYSWDATFKDAETSDYVVGQVWGLKGVEVYLLDQVRDRMDFTTTLAAVVALRAKWARKPTLLRDESVTQLTLIEDAANGPAIISTLRNKIPALLAVPVGKAGKAARLQAVAPLIEAGNVFLPADAAFTMDLIEEAASFPRGEHDDQLDALSQALARLQSGVWNPAEKEEPPPATYEELHAQRMREVIDKRTKGDEDEEMPARYRILRG